MRDAQPTLLATALLTLGCGDASNPSNADTSTTTSTSAPGSESSTPMTDDTMPSTASMSVGESSSATEPPSTSGTDDGSSGHADTSGGTQTEDSGTTGDPTDYEPLCMALADKLEECYPDVDPTEQFDFCIGEIGFAHRAGQMCVDATVGLFTCRSELTCEELDADDACVEYDNMIEAYC